MHWTYDVGVVVVVVIAVQKYMLHIDGVILIWNFIINSLFCFDFFECVCFFCLSFSLYRHVGMDVCVCVCFFRIYFANACSSMIYHCCMTSISIFCSLSLALSLIPALSSIRRTECTSGAVRFCMNTAHSFVWTGVCWRALCIIY